jgi:hypothetical protein
VDKLTAGHAGYGAGERHEEAAACTARVIGAWMSEAFLMQGIVARMELALVGVVLNKTRALIRARAAYSYVNDQDMQQPVYVAMLEHAQEKPCWTWHRKSSWHLAEEKFESGSCLIKSTIALKIHGALNACTVLHVNYMLVYDVRACVWPCGLWSSRCRL